MLGIGAAQHSGTILVKSYDRKVVITHNDDQSLARNLLVGAIEFSFIASAASLEGSLCSFTRR